MFKDFSEAKTVIKALNGLLKSSWKSTESGLSAPSRLSLEELDSMIRNSTA
jgi:hypothetical protein